MFIETIGIILTVLTFKQMRICSVCVHAHVRVCVCSESRVVKKEKEKRFNPMTIYLSNSPHILICIWI